MPGLETYTTQFGSLDAYQKGEIDIIDDDPTRYAFSNMFEVASQSRPWEKVAVGRNRQYVLEVIRAEGTSEWRTAPHDEFALVMDGVVQIELRKLGPDDIGPTAERGSNALEGQPSGQAMGRVVARRGHMTLLPVGAAYRLSADKTAVILLQTQEGPDTIYRWADIIQTVP
ncbi:MAG TPA: hydroxyquinol 1,2-dioxygenase [Candidatus Limnocylindria bacterium]|nr:hydroxyquinol 1,2-dioxygenase [Candidatus Limnocylindria bacterium]